MNTKRQFLLGIFFLTALSVLAFYTLFLTDFTLFSTPTTEVVYFPKANGLREGDPVLVSGMRVGRVGKMEHDLRRDPTKRIRVILNIDDDEKLEILEGYEIEIQESTMLGGRHVEIEPGIFGKPPAVRLEDGGLEGTVQVNPIESLGAVGDLVSENAEAVKKLLDNLNLMSTDALGFIADLKAGTGTFGMLLNDKELAQDISESVENIRQVSADAKAMSAGITEGKGLLGTLLHDDDLVASVKATIDDLRTIADDVKAGKGTVGRLLYDDSLAEETDRAIRSLSSLVAGIEAGNGLVGKLLTDKMLATDISTIVADFKATSADIREVATAVRNGEGSAGKLLRSTELYDEALGALKLLTRSLEDYREAAPISAFTSVLFSGF